MSASPQTPIDAPQRGQAGRAPAFSDWKRPVNIVSLVIGVIGIIGAFFGILAYYDSHKIEKLSFFKSVTKIYDKSSSTTAIRIFDKNNRIISNNVYILSLTMWNSGNINIKAEMVEKPIRFSLVGAGSILDYGILGASRKEVSGFSIEPIEDGNLKSLALKWKFFGKNMRLAAKIIYTGDDKTTIDIDPGYVEDLDELIDVGQVSTRTRLLAWWQFVVICAGLGFLVIYLLLRFYIFREIPLSRKFRLAFGILIVFYIVSAGFSLFTYNRSNTMFIPDFAKGLITSPGSGS